MMAHRFPSVRRAGVAPVALSGLVAVLLAAACTREDSPVAGDGSDIEEPTGSTLVGASDSEPSIANSADRLIFWSSCKSISELTDGDLDRLAAQGVDGFSCVVGRIRGLGGVTAFTPDPTATLAGEAFEVERSLRDGEIVARAAERGMKLYLGFYATNDENHQTPFVEWFDDQGWDEAVSEVESLAATAQQLGFAGVAIDQEIYSPAEDGERATWEWDYPQNLRSEADVRAKARERGAQLMDALLAGFPGLDILAYATHFPGTWEDVVQLEVNGIEDRAEPMVHVNFWDGMTSVEGYGAVRFLNAVFYKTPHIRGATWDAAFAYEFNELSSLLSRSFSNWSYASSRVFASPFLWISEGSTDFESARDPEYVAEQLEAFSRWGMGGEFANFAYNGVEFFDYTPYEEAMQQFSSPRLVDDEAPRVTADAHPVVSQGPNGATATLSGTATDDLAVWAVRWSNDRGGSGTAEMSWEQGDGDFERGWSWRMIWRIDAMPLQPGLNTIRISVEGIKGPSSSVDVTAEG